MQKKTSIYGNVIKFDKISILFQKGLVFKLYFFLILVNIVTDLI